MFSRGKNNLQHDYVRGLRGSIQWLVETSWFQNTIILLICINGITLGLVTSEAIAAWGGGIIPLLNQIIIAVFVVELGLRIVAWGPRFFLSPWSLFDFFIVAIALLPAGGAYSVLRALRILRLLRLISQLGNLRVIIESLLRALPGIGWIGGLLMLIFYVFAVMGTELFGDSFPQLFGSVGLSMYTLFQVMTLESWSEAIARPVMEDHTWAWVYFVTFILISAFTVLNLFIGIIVNSMQSLHWEEEEDKRLEFEGKANAERDEMLQQISELHAKIDRLERSLSQDGARDGSCQNPG